MQIFEHAQVDSTSLELQRLVRDSEFKSFNQTIAVVARSQSQGRGRLGAQWSSPEGGIYLSILLPFLTKDVNLLGVHSLLVGLLVQKWVALQFKTRLSLKWPNDLWWQDQKIGGILCEVENQSMIAGIGLNLYSIPDMNNSPIQVSTIQEVTCVKSIEGEAVDFSKKLAQYIDESWSEELLSNFKKSYEEQPHLKLWNKDDKEVWLHNEVDQSGHLILRNKNNQNQIESSVRSNFTPLKSSDPRLVFVDVGNSNTKLCYATTTEVITNQNIDDNFLSKIFLSIQDPVFVCMQTNSKIWTRIQNILYCLDVPFILLLKSPKRVQTTYNLQLLGIDRLANLEAALDWNIKNHLQFDCLVVVSLGTAHTIDVLERDGRHLGGWILPGFHMQYDALKLKFPHLHLDEDILSPYLLGSSTSFAVNHGIAYSCIYTVEGLIKNLYKNSAYQNIHVLWTGGGTQRVQHLLNGTIVKDLTVSGMRILAF